MKAKIKKPSTQHLAHVIGKSFSVDFYKDEYPDIAATVDDLLSHFCAIGWLEGRSPNASFDVVSYLKRYPDVAESGLHPYYHYLFHGRAEGRVAVEAVQPSTRSRLLFGYGVTDWVGAVRESFDVAHYLSQLSTPMPEGVDPLAHFVFRGWRDGLDASRVLRTAELLRRYPEANHLLVNPCLVMIEQRSGRYSRGDSWGVIDQDEPIPAVLLNDQVDLVKTEFDAGFYEQTNEDVVAAKKDPLDHFFYTGWREGRNPTSDFNTAYYLAENEDVRAADVNPYWHFLAVGRGQGRLPQPIEVATPKKDDAEDLNQMLLMKKEFSPVYYQHRYPDVLAVGIDPLEHYFRTGWREGRNPNHDFDTQYYLDANPDIRDAGCHPFWHYLVAGRAEGRLGARPGGYRRKILDEVKTPQQLSVDYQEASGNFVTRQALKKLLAKASLKRAGLVLSLSHDCYVRVVGGTQIFIADEQARFAEQQFGYLHLSPRRGRLSFAESGSKVDLQVVIDGVYAGLCEAAVIVELLKDIGKDKALKKLLIIHSVFGFSSEQLCDFNRVFQPYRSVYWLHDYSSLCEGYNLLRNDLNFCAAPPPESLACRICIYGSTRALHLKRMNQLFSACNFDVLAPSAHALSVWQQGSSLPVRSAGVHAHWELQSLKSPVSAAKKVNKVKVLADTIAGPIRIGFIGFPSKNKGWGFFEALSASFKDDERYSFYHFAAGGVSNIPNTQFVVTEVLALDRMATVRLLKQHCIDILLVLSPWPETFSFVAHEGVAAGCKVLCLSSSGNVAAMVLAGQFGHVFDSQHALQEFLVTSGAVEMAREARRHPQAAPTILSSGTTASSDVVMKMRRKS